MPLELEQLVQNIQPERTILIFGAGSSIPSGGPTAAQLRDRLVDRFSVGSSSFALAEVASLVERKFSRKELVSELRELFKGLKPAGGLLNLPLYSWRSLYTTNWDTLIEQAYERSGHALKVYSTDFDFTLHSVPEATPLFKIHGTIDRDVSDGQVSRLIVTDADTDLVGNYREKLYDRLKAESGDSHLVIIGHSLGDQDIRTIANRAAELVSKTYGAFRISLLMYERDLDRAQLFESRSFKVCFGGIDDFFERLAIHLPNRSTLHVGEDSFGGVTELRPVTMDVEHASNLPSDFSRMFNGAPATHADIIAGLTFERSVPSDISHLLSSSESICGVLLGASGVGKTTAARQTLQRLRAMGWQTWEHQADHALNASAWRRLASNLKDKGSKGALLVDEAHLHLHEVNDLIEHLCSESNWSLRLLLVSTRNHWNPRVKTPLIFKQGKLFSLDRLANDEIDRLLTLVDTNSTVGALVEQTFAGFSRYERRRRLVDRCDSEMFVCLKNIFASEKFDDIILREYASLDATHQDVYRHVAALESAGVRVHRQLVMRILGVPAATIGAILEHLADIVSEYTVSERDGLYGWRCRHNVIAAIVTRYKYADPAKFAGLLANVIDSLLPTYDIEVRTARELCNVESGIPSIPDKDVQNRLLRKMVSSLPGERVPRHRLIRNLIDMGEFEKAETEIRIFEKDFRRDGPVTRYKIALLLARATRTSGILEEDRVVILESARALASESVGRYPDNKGILTIYCDVGVALFKKTGKYEAFDEALKALRDAEDRIGDPDITRLVRKYGTLLGPEPDREVEAPVEPEP